MRIVFIGAVEFSRFCLAEVLKNGGNVVGVFAPSEQAARGNADRAELAPLASQAGVPFFEFSKIKDPATIGQISGLRPDVIFAWGLSQLIPPELLAIPPMGCLGLHPTLLPQNRGRHPLIWALVDGLPQSGLTFFYLDDGADSGDILWQKPFPIELEDDAASLYRKVERLAADAIAEFLPQLERGTAPRTPQDHTQATYRRKRGEADGLIHWEAPSLRIYNLIRALTHPYVGAHTCVDGRKIILWRARMVEPAAGVPLDAEPGTIIACSPGSLLVRTGDGLVEITEWQNVEQVALSPGTKFDGVAVSSRAVIQGA